jgi:SAM-dependent methyltransferase
VDAIICDHTFEHVDNPESFVEEMGRLLRPGGWVCARTPNRWGYIGLATNLVPNSAHVQVLTKAQPDRKAEDVFPTTYRMNTRAAIARLFPESEWDTFMYSVNAEPAYFGNSARVVRAVDVITSRMPQALGATWHIFLRKKPAVGRSGA